MQATANPTTTTDLAEIMVAEGINLHTSIARADAALIAAGHRYHPAEIRVALVEARAIADIRMSSETGTTETNGLADPQLSIAAAALGDVGEAVTLLEGFAVIDQNETALTAVDRIRSETMRLGYSLGLTPTFTEAETTPATAGTTER